MPDCKKIDCCPPDIYGYQPTFEATATFTALCPVGETGQPVTISKTATSLISQQDAYSIALAQATEEAELLLVCGTDGFSIQLGTIPPSPFSSAGVVLIDQPVDFDLSNQTSYNGSSALNSLDSSGVAGTGTLDRVYSIQSISFTGTVSIIGFSGQVSLDEFSGQAWGVLQIGSSVQGVLYLESFVRTTPGVDIFPTPPASISISPGELIQINMQLFVLANAPTTNPISFIEMELNVT